MRSTATATVRLAALACGAVVAAAGAAAAGPAPAEPPPGAPGGDARELAAREREARRAREEALRAAIAARLGEAGLRGARVSLLVAHARSGRSLFAHGADTTLNAASNVKLVTTAAALARLGPEYRFKTVVYGSRRPEPGSGAVPSLALRGFGDPTLTDEGLERLARDLAVRGLRRAGDLIVDATFLDQERFAPGTEIPEKAHDRDKAFRAPGGAVSLDYNVFRIVVVPGAPGARAAVRLLPASPYLRAEGAVTTARRGVTRISVALEEAPDATVARVAGRIRADAEPFETRRRVLHPDLYAAFTLREALRRRGVRLAGEVRRGTVPESWPVLATALSEPLSALLRDVNKHSNNFMADQLVRVLGAEARGPPGSFHGGLEVVADHLESLGIARGSYTLRNGSGLYDAGRLSAGQLVAVLRHAWLDFRVSADYVATLAVAGADGTLARRLSGRAARRVRAKTGTLNDVTALSGYVGADPGAPAGRGPLAFSILANGLPRGATAATRAIDGIVEAMVDYLEPTRDAAPPGDAAEPPGEAPPGEVPPGEPPPGEPPPGEAAPDAPAPHR